MFYKKNYITSNLKQKGGHDNVTHYVYPSIPVFPYKTCDLNNTNCYKIENIIIGIEYWNENIYPKFYNKFVKQINKIKLNKEHIKKKKYINIKLNELEINISVLIDLIVNQNIDTPCTNKYLCLHYIHKLHEKISNNNMLKLPGDWNNNITKLCKFYKDKKDFNLSWLSNEDIDKALKKFEFKYSNYLHLGTFPIDFQEKDEDSECIGYLFSHRKLKNMNLDNCNFILPSDKKVFSIVLNTDNSDGNGEHWFAIFIDKITNNIYIFDSASTNSENTKNKYIKKLTKNIVKYIGGNKNNNKKHIHYNTVQHQHQSNSECGMYSIYFILSLLHASNNSNSLTVFNKYFNTINKRIPDSFVANLRQFMWDHKNIEQSCNL